MREALIYLCSNACENSSNFCVCEWVAVALWVLWSYQPPPSTCTASRPSQRSSHWVWPPPCFPWRSPGQSSTSAGTRAGSRGWSDPLHTHTHTHKQNLQKHNYNMKQVIVLGCRSHPLPLGSGWCSWGSPCGPSGCSLWCGAAPTTQRSGSCALIGGCPQSEQRWAFYLSK